VVASLSEHANACAPAALPATSPQQVRAATHALMKPVIFFALAAASLGLFSVPSSAQTAQACPDAITPATPNRTVCSKTFYIKGRCGVPQLQYPWDGWQDVAWATVPWEASAITIVSASLDLRVKGAGPISLGTFSGNSYAPDPLTPLRYFDTTGNVLDSHNESPMWPAGSGMRFPAADSSAKLPQAPHIDAHVDCSPRNAVYEGWEFIWYTIP
jgi:hypothetical protein